MRHVVCHHRRLLIHAVGGCAIVAGEKVGRDVKVLLEGKFGIGGVAEKSKRRHGGGMSRRPRDEEREKKKKRKKGARV